MDRLFELPDIPRLNGNEIAASVDDPVELLQRALDAVGRVRVTTTPPDAEAMRVLADEISVARDDALAFERVAWALRHEQYQGEVQERRIRRQLASAARRADLAERKTSGGFYRNQPRTSNRPTHVEVDDAAWATVRQEAIRKRMMVGTAVAALVATASAHDLVERDDSNDHHREHGRRANRFARLFIDDDTWSTFRCLCERAAA